MLAIATLVGSSPVATAPELKEQRTSLRLTAFLPLFHLRVIQKDQGAQETCPWGRGRGQAGPWVSGLFLPLTLLNLHCPLFSFSCFLLPVCDGTKEKGKGIKSSLTHVASKLNGIPNRRWVRLE